jgi:mannose-6-phosphate isomerase-like protein (cupin superfamily)
MDKRDQRLDVSGLGAELVVRPTGSVCDEGDLAFDVIGRPRGFLTHRHVHIGQLERYEVIAGEMRVDLGGRNHLLRAGDRIEVPAGVAHRQLPAGSGPGHVRVTVSPAGRTEEFLWRLQEMSREGQLNRAGLPRPVAGARLIRDFGDAGHATVPPVALQRMASALILAVAGPVQALGALWAAGARRLWREYAFMDEWDVAAPAGPVYEALADGRTYPQWWRPVYIAVDSDGPPVIGRISDQHFKGRLPYHLRTRSKLVRLEPGALIEVEVDGDLRGHGVWRLTPTPTGTHIRFDWTVHADRRLLRVLTPLLRPALRSNHNWAIARAIEGLEPYILSRPQPIVGNSAKAPSNTNLVQIKT